MTQVSKKQYFNDPQPTSMSNAGIVRAENFNLAVADITTLFTYRIANVIVATSTSTTTDFSSLLVGDKVVIVLPAAGNAQFVTVATAGTLPQAAVIGQLYIVIRNNG